MGARLRAAPAAGRCWEALDVRGRRGRLRAMDDSIFKRFRNDILTILRQGISCSNTLIYHQRSSWVKGASRID